MREILFRGKANGGCCWVYGCYAVLNDGYRPDWKRHYLLSGELRYNDQYGKEDIIKVEIDPKTLGQYTGLNDKHGVRIFEGDIVAQPVCKYIVEFDGGAFFLIPIPAHNPYGCPQQLIGFGAMFEVIGNIRDNPELTGGKNDEGAPF